VISANKKHTNYGSFKDHCKKKLVMLLELASYLAKLSSLVGLGLWIESYVNLDTSQGIVPEVINVGPA